MTLERFADAAGAVTPPHRDPAYLAAAEQARGRWSTRAKPPGSLGRLEAVAAHVAGLTGTCPPAVPRRPAVVVFAGDHGVVADGASAWPSEVTAAMVATMVAGGAAINAFARSVGAELTVVDVGVASSLDGIPVGEGARLVSARVRSGTGSLAREPAMSREEAAAALDAGAVAAWRSIDAGADLLVGGEMGIGNTTPSCVLIAHLTRRRGEDAAALVGPGAGTAGDALDRKRAIVVDAVDRVARLDDPLDVLAAVGGLEIAALAGFYVVAAAARVPVVVDGVIAGAALCVADALAPGTAARTIAGHRSTEPAAELALTHLGVVPLLDLDLRLGEGTGACLAVPLVQAACRALRDMADLPQ